MSKKTLSITPAGSSPETHVRSATDGPPSRGVFGPRYASTTPMPRLVGIKEAAEILGCSAVTIRRRVKNGLLAHYRPHGRLQFDPRELRAWLEAHHVYPHEVITKESM